MLGNDGAELERRLDDARTLILRGRVVFWPYLRHWRHVGFVTGVALVVPLVAWVLSRLGVSSVVTVLTALATVVPAAAATLDQVTRWGTKMLDRLTKAEEEVQKATWEPVREEERAVEEARGALAAAEARYEQLTRDGERVTQHVDELEGELTQLTLGRVLVDFADERSTDYRQRLGLLARVRDDLSKVEEAIEQINSDALNPSPRAETAEQPAGPAPEGAPSTTEQEADEPWSPSDAPNRIVLYIDDLDRCPPEKVLQVLEAVHLLLSFRMFVVVVAVDSRWLTSALTDRLVALRPAVSVTAGDVPDGGSAEADQATPQDYLEKIFQLPFWVQPVPAQGRAQLVHGLLKDSVRGPNQTGAGSPPQDRPGDRLQLTEREAEAVDSLLVRYGAEVRQDTSPLLLEPADLVFLETLASLLGDTPRRIKRFVNVCQLLYAMSPPLQRHGTFPQDRRVVAFMAAVGDGLPAVAASLLPELTVVGKSKCNPDRTDQEKARGAVKLYSYVESLTDPANPNGTVTAVSTWTSDRSRLLAWLDHNPPWKDVPLEELDVRIDMIRRLRFERPRPT